VSDVGRARTEIVEVGRRLYARGLIAGTEGNVSVRCGEELVVTPGGVCKGFLAPEDLVTTDLEGRPRGGGRATSEILMHAAVYRRRSDVGAVVHAHPPVATGFAVAGLSLDRPSLAEPVVTLGPVPVIPYETPSTSGLAERVADGIVAAHALLLANHGALTVGEALFRAWERMETLEQFARISLVARLLGRERELEADDVERLEALRATAGYPPPPARAAVQAGIQKGAAPTREELVALVTEAIVRASGGGS
jgi:L-fuculose-phosphate aldolase